MAKTYTINITNGTGTSNVLNGEYSISSNTTGYSNTSIDPNTINVVEGIDTYDLTISAEGTLTIHVTETGEESEAAIIGATFIRCDKDGNTYGNPIVSDTNGNAVFANVPYDTNNPPKIYFKQTASDDSHTFDNTLKDTTLNSSTKTIEIANALPSLKTFNLKDINYEGLPIESGNIILN